MELSPHLRLALLYTKKCTLFSSSKPSCLPHLYFQIDTMQLFYPKGFKGSPLSEYKTGLPLELLMVAEKQKKKRKNLNHLSIKPSQAGFRCSSLELYPYSRDIPSLSPLKQAI